MDSYGLIPGRPEVLTATARTNWHDEYEVMMIDERERRRRHRILIATNAALFGGVAVVGPAVWMIRRSLLAAAMASGSFGLLLWLARMVMTVSSAYESLSCGIAQLISEAHSPSLRQLVSRSRMLGLAVVVLAALAASALHSSWPLQAGILTAAVVVVVSRLQARWTGRQSAFGPEGWNR